MRRHGALPQIRHNLFRVKRPAVLGRIDIDVHHAQHKAKMTNKILVMPSGRGSSSATAVLAELIRTGDGPLGIVMLQCDTILVIGALVSAEIYGISMPIVELAQAEYDQLTDGMNVAIAADSQSQVATVTL